MKRIILSLICVSAVALSAVTLAQGNAPDNSAKNKRDRSGETQTSGDQGNNSQDLKTTAAIRKAIVKDHSLRGTARNIKIITEGGTVTLRGPVKNAAEKTKIEQLAASAAGGAKIENQLEVKESQ